MQQTPAFVFEIRALSWTYFYWNYMA